MHSKKNNFHFAPCDDNRVNHLTFHRNGEKRVGEQILLNNAGDATFVILGINENVGPLANHGKAGSEHAFENAIKYFLNTQVHSGFEAKNCAVLGHIQQFHWEKDVEKCEDLVEELDDFVLEVLNNHVLPHQVPIVIGGGHNNALPLMRWAAKHHALSVINIDPHADCRAFPPRHSGNSFSIALTEMTIKDYAVFGLHEAYNNTFILEFLAKYGCRHTFYEDYLENRKKFLDDVHSYMNEIDENNHIGFEIDLDAIANMPSSAMSPSGWTVDEIRLLLRTLPQKKRISYLHFPEGAPHSDRENTLVGKAIAYFLRDFLTLG